MGYFKYYSIKHTNLNRLQAMSWNVNEDYETWKTYEIKYGKDLIQSLWDWKYFILPWGSCKLHTFRRFTNFMTYLLTLKWLGDVFSIGREINTMWCVQSDREDAGLTHYNTVVSTCRWLHTSEHFFENVMLIIYTNSLASTHQLQRKISRDFMRTDSFFYKRL